MRFQCSFRCERLLRARKVTQTPLDVAPLSATDNCGGFRACRDGVEVASLRLPCMQSSMGENTGDGKPCAAVERQEFSGMAAGNRHRP